MTDAQSAPKVSVIIPTLHLARPKNAKYFMFQRYTLEQVLSDLQQNVKLPREVIVVCNGQDPELVELVKSHQGVDKSCLNSVNVGVSRAWNMGAMLAEGEALCFLNDDVHVGPGAIEELYETLSSDSAIVQVGPKGANWRGAEHERFVGETCIEDADAISGFMFMIRTSAFTDVGGFDTAYSPAGFEEIDMSFMLRRRGGRCVVVPGLDVKHYERHGVSASTGTIGYLGKSIGTRELHNRNKEYFMRKWNLSR
jgi:GT2 family glycosyltransferase